MTEEKDRLDRLESYIEHQARTIDELRRRIDELEAGTADRPQEPAISRRTALAVGGLAGMFTLGSAAGPASADPQGRVGTDARPLEALYTEELNGGITGGVAVTDLIGDALDVTDDSLTVAVDDPLALAGGSVTLDAGSGLAVGDDGLTVEPLIQPPADLGAVLDAMDRDGDGTYVITNVHELQAMNADLDADYRLGNDVNAVGTAFWHGGKGFEPIGDTTDSFTGTFDGDGHVVEGLAINRGYRDHVGLFGDSTGTIERVGLVGVDVTGSRLVGALVGSSEGIVSECYATGEVTGLEYVGGLVGYFVGEVRDAYAIISVSASLFAGGFVGGAFGTVLQSYAAGAVSADAGVGGFVGLEAVASSATYWDVPASGQDTSDGGTGIGSSGDVPPADGMVGDTLDSGFENDFDFVNTWERVSGSDADARRGDDYPVLRALDRGTQLEART